MAVAIDPGVPLAVMVKSDRELPKEKQTTFMMLPMTRKEFGQFSLLDRDGIDGMKAMEHLEKLLAEKLTGWDNFLAPDGKQIKFDDSNKCANVDKIPVGLIGEIFEAYAEANGLSPQQVKN